MYKDCEKPWKNRWSSFDIVGQMDYYKIKLMPQTITEKYIRVPTQEYTRLKQLQKHFEPFWKYITHLQDIKEARQDIKQGRTIPQEKLFKELGL